MNKSRIIFAIISGIILGISFPKLNLWWCAWFAFVPLFFALQGLSGKDAFYIGTIVGVVNFFIVIGWLFVVLRIYTTMQWWQSLSLFFLLLLYLSVYFALFSTVVSYFNKDPVELLLVAPSSWVFFEFLRGILFTGFPWEFIGYSQFKLIYFIQISDLVGVYGVSFLVVSSNVMIYLLFLFLFDKNRLFGAKCLFYCCMFPLLLLLLSFFYGYWRISDVEKRIFHAKRLKIGIVQGNIDQSVKWNPRFQIITTKKYIRLSKLLTGNSDLIVWPETATPFYFGKSPELTDFVIEAIKDIGSDFIIGSPTVCPKMSKCDSYHYNSAYLLNSFGEIQGRYDKSHLVPFGEYYPLRCLSPFFCNLSFNKYDFKNGVPGKVLFWKYGSSLIGLQICYEIIFPKLSRLMSKNGAGLLVNITNDAWFGNSSAAYQHFSMSVFRAIENRKSLVRAANTGISAIISPTGHVLAKTSIFTDEVLAEEVPIFYLETFYTKWGDFFILICTVTVVGVFLKRFVLLFRNKF